MKIMFCLLKRCAGIFYMKSHATNFLLYFVSGVLLPSCSLRECIVRKQWSIVDSGQSTQVSVCRETACIPSTGLTLTCRVYVCVHTSAPATNTIGRYLGSICSWFTEEECQGLSVPLWYAQIRALGPLFKHLGPRVLERPPYPFASKAEEMEE